MIADPPAYTPWYDHELAAALARAGARRRARHFPVPASRSCRRPTATAAAERFYPLSSRVFGRSRARLPLKAAEHLGVAASLARLRADVLHVQWLALPQVDARIRFRSPAVFTAHDLLPRRTAGKRDLWQKLLGLFDRVVVHTERGRETLLELGVEARVIPHPVYPSSAARADDGQTILALGVIRPYKGLADAVEVVAPPRRRPAARRRRPGDGARRAPRRAARPNGGSATSPPAEFDRALSDATIAIFPYRAELDQSGALLQALGAGIPAVAYDVGGLAEPIARYGAGRVVPAGDVEALTEAARELLADPEALAARPRGRRARPCRADVGCRGRTASALYRELL